MILIILLLSSPAFSQEPPPLPEPQNQAQPVQQATPAQAVQSATPTQPVQSATSTQPVQSATPTLPVMQQQPAAATQPVQAAPPGAATQSVQAPQPAPANAAGDDHVYVESADYMKYEKESKLTVLRGGVVLRIQNSKLVADNVTLNENDNTVAAVGAVVLQDDTSNSTISGDALYYDYEKEYFEMAHPRGEGESDGVNGKIYYSGERAWGTRSRIKIQKGWFTTCQPTCPDECHVTAKDITIKPGVKIVARNAFLYIGPRKVWYMPMYEMSLKNKQQNLPEFGYTKEEGFYVKTRYPYLNKDTIAGVILLDFFTRKGVNYGTEHNYTSKFLGGKGYNKFSTINEKDTGRVSTQITQWQDFVFGRQITGKINYSRMSTYSIYQDRSRVNNSNIQFNVNREVKQMLPGTGTQAGTPQPGVTKRQDSFTYTTSAQHSIYESSNSDMSLRQHYFFNPNLDYMYEYRETGNQSGQTPKDREGSYNSTLTKKSKAYTLTARTNKTFDLDGDSFLGDNFNSVNTVLPEATFELAQDVINRALHLKSATKRPNVTFRATHGRYREGTRNNSYIIRRTALDTGVSRTFNLSHNTTLSPQESYTQYMYQTKDARYILTNNTSLSHKFDEWSNLNFNYNRVQDAGGSPYQKDRVGENNSLNGVYSIAKSHTNVSLSSGYNYEIGKYQPANMGYMHGLSRNSTMDVKLGYDLENSLWAPTVTTYKFARKNMDMNIGATWNTKELDLTTSQILAQIHRNNGWKFNIRAQYDHPRYYPFIREWTAIKTRCCTEVQFTYNAERDEYRLNFFILALPHQNIGIYSGQQGLTVDDSIFKSQMGGQGTFAP